MRDCTQPGSERAMCSIALHDNDNQLSGGIHLKMRQYPGDNQVLGCGCRVHAVPLSDAVESWPSSHPGGGSEDVHSQRGKRVACNNDV